MTKKADIDASVPSNASSLLQQGQTYQFADLPNDAAAEKAYGAAIHAHQSGENLTTGSDLSSKGRATRRKRPNQALSLGPIAEVFPKHARTLVPPRASAAASAEVVSQFKQKIRRIGVTLLLA